MTSDEGSSTDRVIIVTGAARGIGRGIATVLSARGARLALVDIDGQTASETAHIVEEAGGQVLTLEADVSQPQAVETAIRGTVDRFGRLDGLVNNAGAIRMGPALDASAAEWKLQYEVNLLGTYLMSRQVAAAMIEHGWKGSIVNVASNAGKVGYPNMAAYNATKAGVVSLTRTLAAEWAEHGINVNAVCPGGVDTPMLHDVASWIADRIDGDATDLLGEMVPAQLGRHVQPDEVGRVVAFLLSDDATIIRGQSINIDGGDTPY